MSWQHKQKILEDLSDEEYFNQAQPNQENPPDFINQNDHSDSIDPLDQFMNCLEQNSQLENIAKKKDAPLNVNQNKNQGLKNQNYDLVQDQNVHFDDEQSIISEKQLENQKDQDQFLSNQEICEGSKKIQEKKIIQNLKPYDFSSVELEDFEKNFYEEHQQISNLTEEEVKKLLKDFQIKVHGAETPRPIISFAHLPFDQKLKRLIVNNQFEKPTPIQAIALPAVLSGRDVVGIAKTGSGKTLAYVWPMIIHVMNQRQSKKNEGPIALVLAPTRQLCQQIFIETKKYSKKYNISVGCLLGGQNKHEQWKSLKAGIQILIASPGRLIEMIKKKATNLLRITYLVLDEADRMLSLGFQQQIRSIVSQTREDRQTLLFTATMKKPMQFLVNDIICSPVRIQVGEEGTANEDVKQEVIIIHERGQKLQWIRLHLHELLVDGKILIFANQRDTCQEIGRFFNQFLRITALVLHGDKNQYERTLIMNSFKADSHILIATDIAARGIDVKNIKTVINFECPKEIEAYIHRIGRAGRAGNTGCSYTFLSNSSSDVKFSISLVKIFENSGYPVSQELEDLACLDDFFRRKRLSSKMGVSFAKGKDAAKFLNQALKRQRKGFSRAGLGLVDSGETQYTSKKEYTGSISIEIQKKGLSISELSQVIRDKCESRNNLEEKFGHFRKQVDQFDKPEQYIESTISYFKPK